jgi:hypothetical protein
LVTAIGTPLCFYLFLRRALANRLTALFLCLILLSCTGFLSVLIAYIRPAKKLNLLFLCAALWLAQRHADSGNRNGFIPMNITLLASFFSDELGLANFIVCGALFNRSLLRQTSTGKRLAFLSLPVVFLAVTNWVLPALYLRYGVHGAWNALADPKKFSVFVYLLDPMFYSAALTQTSRSVLATFGVAKHVAWTEWLAIMALVLAPLVDLIHTRRWSTSELLDNKLLIATTLVFATSFYATLLDWYPFPYEVSYLGSFNYYYHSVIVVPVLTWAGFVVKTDLLKGGEWRAGGGAALATMLTLAIVVANFVVFDRVNSLVAAIHLYPYAPSALYQQLRNKLPLVLDVPKGEGGPIMFTQQPTALESRYLHDLRSVFGPRWADNGFYTTFYLIKPTPIMERPYLDHILRAFFPFHHFAITTRSEG